MSKNDSLFGRVKICWDLPADEHTCSMRSIHAGVARLKETFMFTNNTKRIHQFVPLIAALLFCLTTEAQAGDQNKFWRFDDPNGKSPVDDLYHPKNNPNGWRNDGNNTGPVEIAPDQAIYFGMMNKEDPKSTKSIELELNWFGFNPNTKFRLSATGYFNGLPVTGHISSTKNNMSNIYVSWPGNCPAWEFIKLTNKTTTPQTVTIAPTLKKTTCYVPSTRAADGGAGPDDTFEITDGSFGVITEMLSPSRVTEIQIFPEDRDIDPNAVAEFEAEPETGNWVSELVSIDPLGRPRSGIKYVTDGLGLMPEAVYRAAFTMLESPATRYTLFAFDAEDTEWTEYKIDMPDPDLLSPVEVNFEFIATDGEYLEGIGDWNGWDSVFIGGAHVRSVVSQSIPNSIDIRDDTDITRIFEGADSGAWSFEAWQYIPSDFTTGGTGDFAGSYFNILNTYAPKQPHNPQDWSVQVQFDPNDGLCKVFHGDDINTIDIPYDTDRWVKINIEIDLEKDWTQVYYDDKFVAEYSWTGGVLGGGGGATNIAVVNFFAQGSTSIYYDDLLLKRVEPPPPCPPDLNKDGVLNFFDVSAFLAAFVAGDPAADFTGDNLFNFFDVSAFLAAFTAGCP
jgi:hypothetical protein